MEIISYVLSGELAHQDSMGNVKAIPPGDIQRMSAGTGVRHSEFNHAPQQQTHFLQIWILPDRTGVTPSYEQKTVPAQRKRGQLTLVAGPQPVAHAVKIHADAQMYAGLFDGDESFHQALSSKRKQYLHLISGALTANGQTLNAGDALLISDESQLHLGHARQAEVLLFDLAA